MLDSSFKNMWVIYDSWSQTCLTTDRIGSFPTYCPKLFYHMTRSPYFEPVNMSFSDEFDDIEVMVLEWTVKEVTYSEWAPSKPHSWSFPSQKPPLATKRPFYRIKIGKSNLLTDLSYMSSPFTLVLESYFFFLSSQHVNGVWGFNSWALLSHMKYVTVPSLLTPTIV
jgi:hypothetical protein